MCELDTETLRLQIYCIVFEQPEQLFYTVQNKTHAQTQMQTHTHTHPHPHSYTQLSFKT